MVVPTKKLSRSIYRKRRYQKEKVKALQLQKCKNCGALKPSHRICPECGFYRGKVYFTPQAKKEKE
jgi:large subunit ribosomal protein L32